MGILSNTLDFIHKTFSKTVGYKENIKIIIQGDEYVFTSTIDTGNGGVVPTLGVDSLEIHGDTVQITIGDQVYELPKKGEASPTVGNVVHHRPIVCIDKLSVGKRSISDVYIAVTAERKKSTQSLLNRDTISKLNLKVDAGKKFTNLCQKDTTF